MHLFWMHVISITKNGQHCVLRLYAWFCTMWRKTWFCAPGSLQSLGFEPARCWTLPVLHAAPSILTVLRFMTYISALFIDWFIFALKTFMEEEWFLKSDEELRLAFTSADRHKDFIGYVLLCGSLQRILVIDREGTLHSPDRMVSSFSLELPV